MTIMSSIRDIFATRQIEEPRYPDERRVAYPGRTLSGMVVTADTAVCVSTVWACLRYLSQNVAVLPWHVMRNSDRGGIPATTHPVDWLIYKRPNPEWSSFQFRETLTHWALRWGNGYAEIERDAIGRPIALWPMHPSRTEVLRDTQTNALIYRYHNGGSDYVDLGLNDVFHIRGFGEGPVGVNVMHYAAESIGWARAAQLFGAAFFGGGMTVAGVVTMKKSMSEPALNKLKAQMSKLYRGVRGDKTMYLDEGMDFKPTQIEPEKGQFLATNMFLVEEVCRWFGVPPHKVAHLLRSTNNNVESQVTEVVVDSVVPWSQRFEDEADAKLFGANRPGYYTKMSLNALLRGDTAARSEFYRNLRNIGVYSANDILRREDENLIPVSEGGDKRIVQGQYVTLADVGNAPSAPAAEQPTPQTSQADQAAQNALREMEIIHAS